MILQKRQISRILSIFVSLAVAGAGCSRLLPATPAPTEKTLPTIQIATLMPTSAATLVPTTAAAVPTETQAAGNTQPDYLDDRSNAPALLTSYFNAVNRMEYLRAYSYWEDPQGSQGSFDQFQKGYADTTSVQLTLGQITSDAGAGQIYYSVPAMMKVVKTDGTTQTYEACYTMHISQPAVQGVYPFAPLSIRQAAAKVIDANASAADVLSKVCSELNVPEGSPMSPAPVTNNEDISSANYLDNRSDPTLVIRSFYNAINRQEYLRAYSYWKDPATDLGKLEVFQQGYAKTASVQVSFGEVFTDIGAGQINYSVPTVLIARTTDNKDQLYVGCFTLHLGQPSFQATPPFAPIQITGGKFTQYAAGTDTAPLLAAACPAQ